ncbi:hypothetical protein B0H15DRAFT_1018767 [Mycena belliarum]|uniref:Uncharacterized protein n=1 Tax=Mycena belliarum TaxID=1033014 RepID=A0AAD6UD55_9AGAR|nr:hypothetical protein B0H15DRAFT_1018767 [Mycena belliae]
MYPLPPALEDIVTALVGYADISDQQTRLLTLDPEALFLASRDRTNHFHLRPLPRKTTQQLLERLSDLCVSVPASSIKARLRILSAAVACMRIVQQDILGTLSQHEQHLVLERCDWITKAHATCRPPPYGNFTYDPLVLAAPSMDDVSIGLTNSIATTPDLFPHATTIMSTEHVSFDADPSSLVGRKFSHSAAHETIGILDFGIKLRAGQVFDVAVAGSHSARWVGSLPLPQVKELLIDCIAVV